MFYFINVLLYHCLKMVSLFIVSMFYYNIVKNIVEYIYILL